MRVGDFSSEKGGEPHSDWPLQHIDTKDDWSMTGQSHAKDLSLVGVITDK